MWDFRPQFPNCSENVILFFILTVYLELIFSFVSFSALSSISMKLLKGKKCPGISSSYRGQGQGHQIVLKFSIDRQIPSSGKSFLWEQKIKESYSNQLKERGIWLGLLYRPETSQEWNIARPPGTWGGNSEVARNVGPSSQIFSETAHCGMTCSRFSLTTGSLRGPTFPSLPCPPKSLWGQPAHLKLWVHCLDRWALLIASHHFVCAASAAMNASHLEHF